MSAQNFLIPRKPEELETCGNNGLCWVDEQIECDDSKLQALFSEGQREIGDEAALDTEQFSLLYLCIKSYEQQDPKIRGRLLEYLCHGTLQLLASIAQLLKTADGRDRSAPVVVQHRNGLQQHVFLLQWLAAQADAALAQEAKGSKAAPAARAPAGGRGRKGASGSRASVNNSSSSNAASGSGGVWDWPSRRVLLLRALAAVVQAETLPLFNAPVDRERLVDVCFETARRTLILDEDIVKHDDVAAMVTDIVCLVALKNDRLESVAGMLMAAVQFHEHCSLFVAELARIAETRFKSSFMTTALVAEFCREDPASLADQAAEKGAAYEGVKQAAKLISALCDVQPKVMAGQLALLQPYFACDTYCVRSELVTAVATLLIKGVYNYETAQEAGRGACDDTARQTSRTNCIHLLLDRTMDKSPYTRSRALKEWLRILEHQEKRPVSIVEQLALLQRAIERLVDDSVMVQKAALQLLSVMVVSNPFNTSELNTNKFVVSLRELEEMYREELERRGSAPEAQWQAGTLAVAPDDRDMQEQERDDVEPQQDQGQPGGEGAAAAPAVVGSEIPSQLFEPSQSQEPGPAEPPRLSPAQLSSRLALLDAAAKYCRALSAALPDCGSLLVNNSGSAEVVKEAITLIMHCQKHGVPGSDETVLLIWPLVLARDDAVRNAAVDALDIVHLQHTPPRPTPSGRGALQPSDHALNLIRMVRGATLGELSALEEFVRLMCVRAAGGTTSTAAGAAAGCDVEAAEGGGRLTWEVAEQVARLATRSHPEKALKALGVRHQQPAAFKKSLSSLQCSCCMLAMITPYFRRCLLPYAAKLRELLSTALNELQDAATVRATCSVLGSLAPVLSAADRQCCAEAVLRVVVATDLLHSANWYSAADAAVAAFFALHPCPPTVLEPLVALMVKNELQPHTDSRGGGGGDSTVAASDGAGVSAMQNEQDANGDACTGGGGGGSSSGGVVASAAGPRGACGSTSRLVFLLGSIALRQLAHVDEVARRIRQQRAQRERAALEKRSGGSASAAPSAEDMDIAAQVGLGSMSTDAHLDMTRDAADAELLRPSSLFTACGELFAQMSRHLLKACIPPAGIAAGASDPSTSGGTATDSRSRVGRACQELLGAAVLTMCKLMVADKAYCDKHMVLFFSALTTSHVASGVRCSLLVVAADIAVRWPNVLEPWTAHLFEVLKDTEQSVRMIGLRVLSHLILSDVVKVKGHLSKVALLTCDESKLVSRLAGVLFTTLSEKANKVLLNNIPDVLSNLTHEPDLSSANFRIIMVHLLGFATGKDSDMLKEKLVTRLESTYGPREWRHLALCLQSLPYSEKGLRRIMELLKSYQHTLGDADVYNTFQSLAAHGRKQGDKKGDLREVADEYLKAIEELHVMLRPEEPTQASEELQQAAQEDAAAGEGAGQHVADEAATEGAGQQDAQAPEASSEVPQPAASSSAMSPLPAHSSGASVQVKPEPTSDADCAPLGATATSSARRPADCQGEGGHPDVHRRDQHPSAGADSAATSDSDSSDGERRALTTSRRRTRMRTGDANTDVEHVAAGLRAIKLERVTHIKQEAP